MPELREHSHKLEVLNGWSLEKHARVTEIEEALKKLQETTMINFLNINERLNKLEEDSE